jgi:hypothetical protein
MLQVISLQKSKDFLVVSGFAESPGFKTLDFLSGRFVKSEYKKLFPVWFRLVRVGPIIQVVVFISGA